MSIEAMKLALEAAYLAGFNASGEGYNGEYGIDRPEENAIWKRDRDNELTAIKQALASPQEPVETYIHEYTSKPHPGDFGIPKGHWWQAKQYADAFYTTPPSAPVQDKS